MEAKDTVMGQQDMIRLGGSWGMKQVRVAQAQAEISFKAGQESGCYAEGWANGIREVVEFVLLYAYDTNGDIHIIGESWQAKLKEWGIEKT